MREKQDDAVLAEEKELLARMNNVKSPEEADKLRIEWANFLERNPDWEIPGKIIQAWWNLLK